MTRCDADDAVKSTVIVALGIALLGTRGVIASCCSRVVESLIE